MLIWLGLQQVPKAITDISLTSDVSFNHRDIDVFIEIRITQHNLHNSSEFWIIPQHHEGIHSIDQW